MPIKEKGQNATQIANKGVSTTAPTNGQVLTYNSTSGDWEPAAATGASNAFATIAVSGQDNVVADSGTDTLTLAAGSNVTLTTTAASDTVTIAAAGASLTGVDDLSSSNDSQITIADSVVTVNIDGDDLDFVVESENNATMLVVDGENDRVGVGGAPSASTLEVVGDGTDNQELFGIYEGTSARLAVEGDFNTANNPVRLKSSGGTIASVFTTTSPPKINVGGTNEPGALLELTGSAGTNLELFALTEGGNDRLAFQCDFGGNGNPVTMKSDTQNPIAKVFTTVGRTELHKSALVKAKAQAVLTGTIDPAASTTVTGVSTRFLSEVCIGDSILVTGETRVVTAIASDTSLTVSVAFSDNSNDTTPEVLPCPLTVLQSDGSLALAVNSSNEVSADGVVALKSLSSAPSATADYGKIYSLGTGQTTVANTRLLIHGDLTRLGADGETAFLDHGATGHTVTAAGTAQKDTAQSKYGGSSILLDGNSDYLSVGDHADWDFGAGDFTVEMFVRFASVSGQQTFLSLHGGTTGSREIYWTKQADGKMWCYYYYGSEDSDTALNQAWGPSVDTWYHVAMCRDGANLRFFVDGTQLGSTHDISTRDLQESGYALQIGSLLNTSDAQVSYLNGWVDEIRISKGTAHYTANFTAPTAAFSGKGELYVQNGAGTATKISPHNLKGEWEYYSKAPDGAVTRINMEEVVRDLGQLTGKNYIKGE